MEMQFSTLEQRLALLMEMPTFSDSAINCQKAIESLADELESFGMHVTISPSKHPHLVATTHKTKRPKLMLVAHLDVVPETDGARCELVVRDNKLTGRGVYDMKFAAACYLELVHELAGRNELSRYDFGIMLTTDEEVGGENGVTRLLGQGWSAGLAVIPDGGENWGVELAAKGITILQLTAHGRSAHGSRPWEGDNAIDKLVTLLDEIRSNYPHESEDALTLSINQISGGQAVNQIADHAQAVIDMRAFTPGELESAENSIRIASKKHSIDVERLMNGKPVALDLENPIIQTALGTLEQFQGHPVNYTKSYGATDGRWFSLYNIPTFIVRPTGGNIHGPGEWMLREDLPKFYDFLKQLTEDIARAEVDKPALQTQTTTV